MGLTIAVSVTDVPATAGDGAAVSVVLVWVVLTICVTTFDVLGPMFWSPG
jgi:hypothetical protein